MQAIQTLVQRQFRTLLLLFIAGGFLMLLVELLWTAHMEGTQRVAVIASGVGFLLASVSIWARGTLRTTLVILFLLLSLTGIVGVVEHYAERNEEAAAPAILTAQLTHMQNVAMRIDKAKEEGEKEEEEERRGEATPPPLAPLSLAGLALFGALVLVGAENKDA